MSRPERTSSGMSKFKGSDRSNKRLQGKKIKRIEGQELNKGHQKNVLTFS